jgi:hypothetical protein
MIISQAKLAISNYEIHIAQDQHGCIYCFKHTKNNTYCDWEYFTDLDLATDYIFSSVLAKTKVQSPDSSE